MARTGRDLCKSRAGTGEVSWSRGNISWALEDTQGGRTATQGRELGAQRAGDRMLVHLAAGLGYPGYPQQWGAIGLLSRGEALFGTCLVPGEIEGQEIW